MDQILKMSVEEMAGISFDCSCGERHSVDINEIIIGNGLTSDIVRIASRFKNGRIFIISDNNTYRVFGENIEESLKNSGLTIKSYVFNEKHTLVPDEKAIGRLLIEIEQETTLIITVGSGSLNDLSKLVSFKLGIPYIIAATAPSMDGYASKGSALIEDGFKKSYDTIYPYAIIADIDIIKHAPIDMIRAGIGDIIGKFTALADWDLSRKLNDEYYCETSVKLVKNAMNKCFKNIEKIQACDEKAIGYMMEALIVVGIAMGLVGNSRPASGAEHHMAHYWEMDSLARSEEHPLHGNSVGVGTVVISSIYDLIKEKCPVSINVIKPEEIRCMLKKAEAADNPNMLGINRELFKKSVLHAMEVRPRYTVLQLASKMGVLEDYADLLTERFYSLSKE